MKFCFIIQCHKKTNPLIYNINKLSSYPNVKIYIHVDRKADILNFNDLSRPNVYLIKNRIDVTWGGVSQIKVALNLFEEVKDFNFDYVSFISGDDVFCKCLTDFEVFLTKNYGAEFIGFQSDTKVDERFIYNYPKVFHDRSDSFYNKLMRRFYRFIFKFGFKKNTKTCSLSVFYKGSNWFTITKECMLYFLSRIESETELLDFFENSFCCDEVFFQTIIMDSPFTNNIYQSEDDDNFSSLRYIDWKTGPDYPRNLNECDLKYNFSKDIFFIRKVNEDISLRFLVERFG